jgi:polysaccharide pyruvyl transferase WcaK-like protein
MRRVLVIGAYGGDHIGDTAIFGGVLLRIHERHGTTDAILVSQRPEHTRRLAAMLDVPVDVTVEEYRQETVRALVDSVDGVVFAGGPLMDLPKQLVKHLYAVAHARRRGKPFVIEGIGAGPFIRRVSAWTARLLVLMAERITVRTADDARAPLLRGLDPVVGRDPAFDYLETRAAVLTRLPADDRRWLDRLFYGTGGRLAVGINLRPIRPDYTVGAPPAQRAEYTRRIESRFEAQLAEAMRHFHDASPQPPCFIFYPMNAIQFGSSDLRSAYRLKRLLGDAVDFRIWEGDPSIDGVIALLRRVDVAITMRFHATIYALSQGTRVIGIDYRPGKKDKVAALLDDAGQAQNCCRIDEMTADWMFERLMELTGSAGPVRPGWTTAGIAGTTLQPVRPPASR